MKKKAQKNESYKALIRSPTTVGYFDVCERYIYVRDCGCGFDRGGGGKYWWEQQSVLQPNDSMIAVVLNGSNGGEVIGKRTL